MRVQACPFSICPAPYAQAGAIAASLVSSATSLAMDRESVRSREVEKTHQLAYLNVLLVNNQIQNRKHPDTSV